MRPKQRHRLITLPQHQLGRVTIEKALPTDRKYIDDLQRKHVNNVGFVPTTAIENHLQRRSYDLLTINGQPVGYSMHAGGQRKPHRLIQVAIEEDAWRTGLGTVLVCVALAEADRKPLPTMTCTVRDGLPMNSVVIQTGAEITAYDTTPKARRRRLVHYTWQPNQPPTLPYPRHSPDQHPHEKHTPPPHSPPIWTPTSP